MSYGLRLFVGVAMGCIVFLVAAYFVPSLGFVSNAVKATRWLSRGDVTQIVLFVTSTVLIILIGRGDTGMFGIQRAAASHIKRSVLLSTAVCSVLVAAGILCVAASGGSLRPESSATAVAGGSVKAIVSIWIMASIAEELFFRGLIMGFLSPLKNWGFRIMGAYLSVPVIVSAVGFSLGHLLLLGVLDARMVAVIVANAAILGLIAGYYREQSGSLVPAIAAHMTFNIVGAIVGSAVTMLAEKIL